jgi:hypothetical protein
LSRSLFAAGIPSVIVSLWSVGDDSTEFLMTEFYQNLQSGMNKAQSLRQAILKTREDFSGHPDTLTLSHQAYHIILQLLCCRSKILYAYHQARLCNRAARELCSQIEKRVEEFGQMKAESENPEERTKRVEQLKAWLIEIQQTGFKYAHRLRDMEDHKTAIAINSENYCYWFSQIRNHSLPEDDLDFLEKFLNRICKHFQEQIQVDLRYLTPAQALFQQMIDTIRGIVEIEAEKQAQEREQKQKERDRKLQDTIQCLGVGIGAASIVASTTGYLTQKDSVAMPFNSYSIHPFTLSLILSVVAGGVFYAGAWWISGFINPRRHKTAKLQGSANNKLLNSASTPIAGQVIGEPFRTGHSKQHS